MGLGPHLLRPRCPDEAMVPTMRNARLTVATLRAERPDENDSSTLFYAMSGIFLSLFGFVIWYCPRHL